MGESEVTAAETDRLFIPTVDHLIVRISIWVSKQNLFQQIFDIYFKVYCDWSGLTAAENQWTTETKIIVNKYLFEYFCEVKAQHLLSTGLCLSIGKWCKSIGHKDLMVSLQYIRIWLFLSKHKNIFCSQLILESLSPLMSSNNESFTQMFTLIER